MGYLNKPHPQWLRNDFLRNIVILVSGTAIAQVAGLMFVPWITRIYGPEAFGGLSYFSSLIGFLTPVAALCYPLALVLPKHSIEARLIFDLCFKISVGVSLLAILVFVIIESMNFGIFPFSGSYVLVPLGIFLSASVVVYSQWAIRLGQYRLIATVTIFSALAGGASKVALGYFYPTNLSLILVTLSILILNVIILCKKLGMIAKPSEILSIRVRHRAVAKKYIRFPIFRMPHSVVAIISQIAPIFLLTAFFGAKYAGYFALTRTILSLPVTLIGKAVYDASYPRIAQRYNDYIGSYGFILKLTASLAAMSILPLAFIFVAGESIFSFAFGSDWQRSGIYAVWMALWFAFNFSNKAVAAAASVYGMDGFLFSNGILNMTLSFLGFFFGAIYYESDIASVALFSLAGIFCQFLLIIRVLQVVRRAELDRNFTQDFKK